MHVLSLGMNSGMYLLSSKGVAKEVASSAFAAKAG